MAVKFPPTQETFLRKLSDFQQEIDWTLNHMVWNFTLPTSYVAPGQDDVEFEESKVRIPIDSRKVNLIATYNQTQLQDVIQGWILYIKQNMKAMKDKVSYGNMPTDNY